MRTIRRTDIELRVLTALRILRSTGQIEDTGLELKGTPPIAESKSRQLAGAANSAGGDPIVWVFGLSDHGDSVDIRDFKFDEWFVAMPGQFDGPYPEPTFAWMEFEDKPCLAVSFRTDQAPYVVKRRENPRERDVPWREGAMTRSASRSEILRTFLPQVRMPNVEIVGGSIAFEPKPGQHPDQLQDVMLSMEVLIEPSDATYFHLSKLRSSATIRFGEHLFSTQAGELHLDSGDQSVATSGVKVSGAGLHIYGAGTFTISTGRLGSVLKEDLAQITHGMAAITLGFGPPVGSVLGEATSRDQANGRLRFRAGTPLALARI